MPISNRSILHNISLDIWREIFRSLTSLPLLPALNVSSDLTSLLVGVVVGFVGEYNVLLLGFASLLNDCSTDECPRRGNCELGPYSGAIGGGGAVKFDITGGGGILKSGVTPVKIAHLLNYIRIDRYTLRNTQKLLSDSRRSYHVPISIVRSCHKLFVMAHHQ